MQSHTSSWIRFIWSAVHQILIKKLPPLTICEFYIFYLNICLSRSQGSHSTDLSYFSEYLHHMTDPQLVENNLSCPRESQQRWKYRGLSLLLAVVFLLFWEQYFHRKLCFLRTRPLGSTNECHRCFKTPYQCLFII